jgi:thiol-disulfide isomerase/thioredoxin
MGVAILLTLIPVTTLGADGGASDAAIDLGRWKGQVVLLDFWASWCGPCRQSFPWIEQTRERYAEQGLVVVAVNVDADRAEADRFLEGTSYGFEFVYDPEGRIADAYALDAMPSSILFDREGQPRYRHSGFRLEETEDYERNIVALLEGRVDTDVVDVAATRGSQRGVQPWQKDFLALEVMSFELDPLDMAIDDHIYFSKEASSGGRGFGGGGCGCN